jgi:type II secretory pathway pseudopilin PulG
MIRKTQHPAYTLVEVLMALVITALVGTAVLAMMSATAYGASDRQSLRELLVRSTTLEARLGAAIRGSLEASDASTDYLILWVADTDESGDRNNGEMQLIERDTSTNELLSYRDPADTSDFTTPSSFRSLAKTSYPSQRWVTGTAAASFSIDAATGGTALVSYSFTLQRQNASESMIGAASLRQ